jgi:serine O-acetyltransferase
MLFKKRSIRLQKPAMSLWAVIRLCLVEGRVLALVLIRIAQYLHNKRIVWRLAPLVKRCNEMVTGVECHLKARIGEGLFIAHTQNIVIGEGVCIGKCVTLFNGVTLGSRQRGRDTGMQRYPILEDGVAVYSGAKVLGAVVLGVKAVVGANAVVLQNIPAGHVAVGVPARILPPSGLSA